ncbi:MAG: DUF1822 family protein [Cyanobacteriota bacterium]|nr:DUF1822 family protein [Cyanobacteriota bacterium]
MKKLTQEPSFSVPITLEAHQLAQKLRVVQRHPKKAKKVYLNTLVIHAVNSYLNCLGIETNWPCDDSSRGGMQLFEDRSELSVKNIGIIECRPVLPDDHFCSIPLEIRGEQMGYVAVRLDGELKEAKLLGFLSSERLKELGDREKIDLNEFGELDNLLDALEPPIQLSQWLHDIAEALQSGWQTLNDLLEPQSIEPVVSFRSKKLENVLSPEESVTGIRLGKILNFEPDCKIIFSVGIKPAENDELEINVDFFSVNRETYLPQDLQVSVLDENNETIMYKKTKQTHQSFPFQFFGQPGDSFCIKIVFGNRSLLESFVL